MRSISLTQPIRQLALAVAGFLAAMVLLESGGLASWANRLEIGPLRTVAVPVTAAVQKALDPLGMGAIRDHALEALARAGWSDDPARLAEAANTPRSGDLPRASGCATPASATALNPPSAHGPGSGTTSPQPGAHNLSPNAPGAQTPLLPDLPRATVLAPLPPVEPGKPRVVALAGDSMMAVGLSATLMRQAAGNKNLRIVKVFRSGTGLARPEVFDWMDEYPAMLGAEKPDVVIVAIGANDGQGFVVDGKVLPYGSEGWLQVYQERLANFLAMVEAGGARVVWVGLPPMRVPVYEQKTATINRIAYTVVSQSPQAVWMNLAAYVGDGAGKFQEFVTLANGRSIRIRSTDGIHLSDEGADLVSTVLLKWLDPPSPAANGAAPAPAIQARPAARPRRRARRLARG
jgi:lysophospholipase L1-like esterase